jgi:hypothetical protein
LLYHEGEVVICIALAVLFSAALAGCVSDRSVSLPVPSNLLSEEKVAHPIFDNTVVVTVPENPDIQTTIRLEESIRDALETALRIANLFGDDSSEPFQVVADVVTWDQPSRDFGMFAGTLETRYVLFDADNNVILDEQIVANACSDKWYFPGYMRAARSRRIQIAKNVNQFVDVLRSLALGENSKEPQPAEPASTKSPDSVRDGDPIELLRKLHELHEEGILSDEEYLLKKREILERL